MKISDNIKSGQTFAAGIDCFQVGTWMATDVTHAAKNFTLKSPRFALESVHGGGTLTDDAIERAVFQGLTSIIIALSVRTKEEFLLSGGLLLGIDDYWLDPKINTSVLTNAPEVKAQNLSPQELKKLMMDITVKALTVGEIEGRIISNSRREFKAFSDAEMMSVNIAMTNYVYDRLLFARGGEHQPNIDPSDYYDHFNGRCPSFMSIGCTSELRRKMPEHNIKVNKIIPEF